MNSNITISQPPISLRNFLNVIFKWKKPILAVFGAIVLTISLGSFLLTPTYRATSNVLLTPESNNEMAILLGISVRKNNQYGKDILASEIEILTSRPVAQHVIQHLRLDQAFFQEKRIIDPALQKIELEKLITNFQKNIIIDRANGSDVLKISYESNDAKMAMNLVNTLVDSYVEYREELFNANSEFEFYNQQINVTTEALNELEERLATFKYGEGLPSPELQTKIVLGKIADFEKSIAEVRRKRISRESTLSVLESQKTDLANVTIPSTQTSDSPSRERYIATLRGELLTLELQRSKLQQKFTGEYPEIKNLTAEIEATRLTIEKEVVQIIREEKIAVAALKAEEAVLQEKINELNNELRSLSQLEFQLGKISRGIDDNREIYSMLLKQREQSKMTMARNRSLIPVKIINRAAEPVQPVRPNHKINFIFSLIIGLVLGIGLAFILEHFSHTFDSPEDIEKYLGYETLASVNYVSEMKEISQPLN